MCGSEITSRSYRHDQLRYRADPAYTGGVLHVSKARNFVFIRGAWRLYFSRRPDYGLADVATLVSALPRPTAVPPSFDTKSRLKCSPASYATTRLAAELRSTAQLDSTKPQAARVRPGWAEAHITRTGPDR